MTSRSLGAVVFDLDDTLFPQEVWLKGALHAVVAVAPPCVPKDEFGDALHAFMAQGSDRGRIIDRALISIGCATVPVEPLVAAFLGYSPALLHTYPGVREALRRVRATVPVGLVTDGYPPAQRAKLRALTLESEFDAIVLSDELGRGFRKPHPAPFLAAATQLGVPADRCLFVGDRPEKDVDGAAAAGFLGCVRVRTGEYAAISCQPCDALAESDDVSSACEWILNRFGTWSRPTSRSRPAPRHTG